VLGGIGLSLTGIYACNEGCANVPGIFFWITMATTRMPAIEGLIQRLGIVFVLIWVEVMAWAMVRTVRGPQPPHVRQER
jgi:hypothetical protein